MTIHRACRDAGNILEYVNGLVAEQEQTTQIEAQPVADLPDPSVPIEQHVMSIAQERVFRDAMENGDSADTAREKALTPVAKSAPVEATTKRDIPTMKVDPEAEFAQALKDAGLVVTGPVLMDGQMHRVPVMKDGKFRPGTKDGAYVGHLDGRPAGYIKNHYTGEERKWKATGQLSQSESRDISRQAQKHLAERKETIARGYAEAANTADQFMSEKCSLSKNHPYLEKKGITLSGNQQILVSERGTLIVRVHDAKGKTQGFQGINPEGDKRFLKGSKKQGGLHMIGEPTDSKNILVCEGYATGQSLHQATGLPVAVAFDAGNLSSVARAVQEAYVQASMFIMGDEDRSKDQNIGRVKAEEAARAVGGRAIFPTSTKGKSVDFNDMAKSKGSAAVKAVVESGIAKGKAREDRQLEVKDSPKIGMKV